MSRAGLAGSGKGGPATFLLAPLSFPGSRPPFSPPFYPLDLCETLRLLEHDSIKHNATKPSVRWSTKISTKFSVLQKPLLEVLSVVRIGTVTLCLTEKRQIEYSQNRVFGEFFCRANTLFSFESQSRGIPPLNILTSLLGSASVVGSYATLSFSSIVPQCHCSLHRY